MIYYRVKPQYDQKRKNPMHARNCDFLIANELYTEKEREAMTKVSDDAFERIEVSKSQTYWFFGARFQKRESPFAKMPMLKGGV